MATEFPEHVSLVQLENSVLSDIKDFGESFGDPQKQPQRIEAAIQSKLSQIRALNRDLELLVEELDRYSPILLLIVSVTIVYDYVCTNVDSLLFVAAMKTENLSPTFSPLMPANTITFSRHSKPQPSRDDSKLPK